MIRRRRLKRFKYRKLSEDQVREARTRYQKKTKYSCNFFARKFGVTYYSIWCVVHFKTYKWVTA